MGYHTKEINKGIYGEFSKIQEEFEEASDAVLQDNQILLINEICDLYGAIEEFVSRRGYTMEQIKQQSDLTKKAFKSGRRTSNAVKLSKDVEILVMTDGVAKDNEVQPIAGESGAFLGKLRDFLITKGIAMSKGAVYKYVKLFNDYDGKMSLANKTIYLDEVLREKFHRFVLKNEMNKFHM